MSKEIIFFSAPWCKSCNVIKERLNDDLKKELNIKIVDISKEINESIKYEIMSVPTIIKIENEKETNRIIGNISIKDLKVL